MVGGDGLEGGAAVCCINSLAVIDRADSGGNGGRGCLGKGKKSRGGSDLECMQVKFYVCLWGGGQEKSELLITRAEADVADWWPRL